ncbi:MAG: DUF4440 domain-containing protein [Bacteroidota bacterium]
MKRITWIFLLSIGLYPLYAQMEKEPKEEWIEPFLENYNQTYTDAFETGNLELLVQYLREDLYFMPSFQKAALKKEHVRAYYQAFFERFEVRACEREILEIVDLGAKVLELGSVSWELSEGVGNDTLHGKYLNVWEKGSNQALQLVAAGWNYNHFVDFADRLRFRTVPTIHLALASHVPIDNPISFDLAALNALSEKTISQGNAEVWAQMYSDDGMFIYSFNPFYQGRKALDDFLQKHVQELPVFEHLDIRTFAIDNLENGYVIEYATHVANWRNGKDSGVSTGKGIRVLRREPSGSLKVFRHISMYD